MRRISGRIAVFLLCILLTLIPSGMTVSAVDRDIVPTDRQNLADLSEAFFQDNIIARASSFTANYSGFWVSSTYKTEQVNGDTVIVPTEEYFASLDPYVRMFDRPGNDYSAIALQSGSTFGLSTSFGSLAGMITHLSDSYSVNWGESLDQTKAVSDYAANVVAAVIKPDMSDKDKIMALHDYIVNNFEYDIGQTVRFPYDFILQKKGVCSAYAGLMWQLLTKVGIESRIILKDAKSGEDPDRSKWVEHSWNLVLLDGNWYHVDVTWDDPVTSNGTPMLSYDFFLKSDSYMASTHTWDPAPYEAAPADYAGQVTVRTATAVKQTAAATSSASAAVTTAPPFDASRILGFLPGSTQALINKYYLWIIGFIVLLILIGIIGRISRRRR